MNDEIRDKMLEAAAMMKEACRMKHENGGTCKGCPFNRLTSGKGEYDDYEWSDEDDKNYTNFTYCNLYFGEETIPMYWNLEGMV